MNKKLILCCAGIAILTGCTGKKSQQAVTTSASDPLYMLVGSYGPADQEGIKVIGEGQYVSGVKGISNPSYQTVSKDGKRVYSVGEDDGGTASAHTLTFDAATGTLTLINSQPTQGAAPCHIALSPEEDYVVTANYNGSNISLFPLLRRQRSRQGTPGHSPPALRLLHAGQPLPAGQRPRYRPHPPLPAEHPTEGQQHAVGGQTACFRHPVDSRLRPTPRRILRRRPLCLPHHGTFRRSNGLHL